MNTAALDDATAARHADADLLRSALADTRARLLRQFAAYERALGASGYAVPLSAELNPPLWELGHVGWFEEYWIARFGQRHLGIDSDPATPRAASVVARADAMYHSGLVPHDSRWRLDLPDADRTQRDLQRIRERTLRLLDIAGGDDAALYFFRLALFHEDMHREAWVYMAQTLGFEPDVEQVGPLASPLDGQRWQLPGGTVAIGSEPGGFAFDNELGRHELRLADFEIDRAPVSWARYLEFVQAGGYAEPRWWTPEGWAWRKACNAAGPRYLAREEGGPWMQRRFGRLTELDVAAPALHLTAHEARAWCRWAGRRLPTEAEWEHAAACAGSTGEAFDWGQVWEWTASAFTPYPGFEPHPYRDYSAPWFDGRPVLRGASFATAPRMRSARYRNFFPAERNDIFAGFRSCAP